MKTVIAFCPRDYDQAARLSEWMGELGPYHGHSLLVVRDARCNGSGLFNGLNFDKFEEIINPTVVDGWPQGGNFVFAMAARHIMATQAEPWLFIEPDAIPLRKGWIDALEKEYKEAGKPFLGDYVNVENVPVHMSGVAIYPADLILYGAGRALNSYEHAWDVVIADATVAQMHDSKLIEHAWKHPTFPDWASVDREVDLANAVLYHSSKDGSLIERLREHNFPAPVLAKSPRTDTEPRPTPQLATAEVGIASTAENGGEARESTSAADSGEKEYSRGGELICDILIKSYPKDYEWLSYCLRGLARFATRFRDIIIIYPMGERSPTFPQDIVLSRIRLIPVQENGEPYLFQQSIKFSAHEWTNSSYILHIDSDTVPCAPFCPDSFFLDGKPLWLMTPYSAISTPWQAPTERFLGHPVEYEFMRRFPIMLPRSLHVAAAKFVELRHGKSATEYIVSQPGKDFSEFNALGALAYARARDDFSWLDTTKEDLPPLVAIQSWSHGGMTDEVKAKFENILSSGLNEEGNGSVPGSCHPVVKPAPPAENVFPMGMGDTEPVPIEFLMGELAKHFTSPLAKGRIFKKLKKYPIVKT